MLASRAPELPRVPQRARRRAGLEHGDDPCSRRWSDRQGRLPGRRDGQAGRPAAGDRPRPFQAALDQAAAKKALDEALLANSKRDIERYSKVGTLAVSQQQIDTQAALVNQQEAQSNPTRPSTTRRCSSATRRSSRRLPAPGIPPCRPRQHRARRRPAGRRGHHPDPADRGHIHCARGGIAAINVALKGGPLPVTALTSDGKQELDKARSRSSTTRWTSRPARFA